MANIKYTTMGTNRRNRAENDFYPTPGYVVEKCWQILLSHTYRKGRKLHVLDPGAGLGAWGKHAPLDLNFEITGVELNPEFTKPDEYVAWYTDNYLTWIPDQEYDIVIGNPPFSHGLEFLKKSFYKVAYFGAVGFLLPVAFLTSAKRHEFFLKCPPDTVYIFSERIDFTGKKSPHDNMAFYVWGTQMNALKQTTIEWLSFNETSGKLPFTIKEQINVHLSGQNSGFLTSASTYDHPEWRRLARLGYCKIVGQRLGFYQIQLSEKIKELL